MPTMKIELTQAQHRRLEQHAEEKDREPEDDLVAVWWGRMSALDKYAERVKQSGAKFRPYAPRKLKEEDRVEVKTKAVKQGVAPVLTKLRVLKGPPRPRKKAWPPGMKEALERLAKRSAGLGKKKRKQQSAKKIDGLDSAQVAVAKARQVEEAGGPPALATLTQSGRTEAGAPVKTGEKK